MIRRGLVGLLLLLPACAGTPKVDPAFPLTEDAALADLARMREDPRRLARPLVVVGGFFDPGFASRGLARRLGDLVDDDRILADVGRRLRGEAPFSRMPGD